MSDWISVEDRLPEYGKPVLLAFDCEDEYRVIEGYREQTDRMGEHYSRRGNFPVFAVTYWQPLPKPPEYPK